MQLAINLLTLVLVVVALFLGLLILLQLPKKEAGITAAFGAESTAAIFGAQSGTALTKLTRYAATGFLSLCLVIAIMTSRQAASRSEKMLKAATTPAAASTTVPANPLGGTTPATPAAATPAPATPSAPISLPTPPPAAPKP